MRRRAFLILAVGLLLAANAPKDDPAGIEKKKFEGTWSLVSLEVNGQAADVDKLRGAKLTIKGAQYSFQLGDMRLELTHKVGPNQKPKTLDLTLVEGAQKGKTLYAIYELEGDTLKICRNLEPQKDRPTEFATKPNSELMLIVWKRDKP
jgi:uncharacterized protein (TIGR03067 family)